MKVIAVSALLLLGQIAFSQEKVNGSTGSKKSIEKMNEANTMKLEDLIEKAGDYFDDSAYAQAASVYNTVAKRSAVNSDMHWGAMSGIAEIHARTGDYTAERQQYLRMQNLYKEGGEAAAAMQEISGCGNQIDKLPQGPGADQST